MRFVAPLLLALFVFRGDVVADEPKVPIEKLTVAEKSDYEATSTSAEVVELVERIVEVSPIVSRFTFGKTVEGRDMIAAVAAQPHVTTPLKPDDHRLVVLLLGNIHAGECAGKEALLRLLRELGLAANHPWMKHLVILFVPNYNADGNDKTAKDNRPGQVGPKNGMGTRANAQGLDLNRDFVKLESPEARAFVRLIDEWSPHVFIDCHTTNGSRHRYALTYDVPHNPSAATAAVVYARNMMKTVTETLTKRGLDTFYYGNFDRDHTRWSTYGHQPRYSTEYVGLRGRIAILSEAYSYIPYRERIEATHAFVSACIDHVAQVNETVALRSLLSPTTLPSEVAIRAEIAPFADKVVLKGYEATGKRAPGPIENGVPKDHTVEFWGRFDPTLTAKRPVAYAIPPTHENIVEHLRRHGIEVTKAEADQERAVRVSKPTDLQKSPATFQGHQLVTVNTTTTEGRRTIPKGWFLVDATQRLGNLAVYLLDPRSDDGLVTWNFFDDDLEGEFPVLEVLD